MKNIIIPFFVILLAIGVSSCVHRSHEIFHSNIGSSVNTNINIWGTRIGEGGGFGTPGLIDIIDAGDYKKYVFQKGDVCKWYFLVSNRSGIIHNYEYLSDPEACIAQDGPRL